METSAQVTVDPLQPWRAIRKGKLAESALDQHRAQGLMHLTVSTHDDKVFSIQVW